MFPPELFAALEARARDLLTPRGYRVAKVELADPFGSRYAEYESPGTVVSLVWDGKESWLTLTERSLSKARAPVAGKELFFESFPGLAVGRSSYEGAAERLLAVLAGRVSNVV